MTDKVEVIKIIREILLENLEVDPGPLKDGDMLHGGEVVSLDSMEFMELAFSLEQKFDIPFDEETVNLENVMLSINTIADYIMESRGAESDNTAPAVRNKTVADLTEPQPQPQPQHS